MDRSIDAITNRRTYRFEFANKPTRAVKRRRYVNSAVFFCLILGIATPLNAAIVDSFYSETANHFTWRFTWDGAAGPLGFSIDAINAATPASVYWQAPPTVPIPDPTVPGGVREQAINGARGPVAGFVNRAQLLAGGDVAAGSDLFLAIQHVTGPHVGVDVDPGNRMVSATPKADFTAMAGPAFAQIGSTIVLDHTPHQDRYTLSYRSIGGGGTEFQITGVHTPLPSSLWLLVSALGTVIWHRRKSNPKPLINKRR